jgi:uncharacterized membrane protein SpoIIM required for sporulation
MKQQDFERRFASRWDAFERWVEPQPSTLPAQPAQGASGQPAGRDAIGPVPAGHSAPEPTLQLSEIPQRYRELCQHLALARDREYSAELVERLSRLALAGHQRLYGAHGSALAAMGRFVIEGFPQAVRAQSRYVLLAALLFFGPLLLLTGALQRHPEFAYVVLPAEYVEGFQEMYGDQARALGRKRDADDDAVMFGYYIWNNVRIGFQSFAGGIVFGLGTAFYLLYNGVVIGTVTGYLVQAGLGSNFFSFTSGHSAFELSAIVLCGAAGLRIGHALIAPGRRRRGDALRAGAAQAIPVVIGAAGMLVLAAGIEAFWSPRTEIALPVKFGFGLTLWLLTAAYFALMGRRRAA